MKRPSCMNLATKTIRPYRRDHATASRADNTRLRASAKRISFPDHKIPRRANERRVQHTHRGGDELGDGASDALDGVLEGVLLAHALPRVARVQALHDAVHAAQQHAALAEDVRAVLRLQRRGCAIIPIPSHPLSSARILSRSASCPDGAAVHVLVPQCSAPPSKRRSRGVREREEWSRSRQRYTHRT